MHNNSQIDQIKLRQETVKKDRVLYKCMNEGVSMSIYNQWEAGLGLDSSVVHYGNKSL